MNYLQKIGNNTPIKEERVELKMKQKLTRKEFKERKGITLIALVVTIVVLLILAGITINYVFSEGGLFDTAKNSGNTWHDAENSDINALNDLNGMIGNLVNGTGSGGTTDPDTPTPDDPTPPAEVTSVTGVKLNINAVTLKVGGTPEQATTTLTATVEPSNATNKNITWSSNDSSVAEVSNNGTITAKAVGIATITVTTEDGSKTVSCTVTVEDGSPLAEFAKVGTFVTDDNKDTDKEYKELEDRYGNKVRVPKGFKVVKTEDVTVPAGIVIEDETSTATTTGNQFVWIPVGTVYMDEARTAEKAKQVQLGRYKFRQDDMPFINAKAGDPMTVQLAFNGDTPNYVENQDLYPIEWAGKKQDKYGNEALTRELATRGVSYTGDNAIAKDLAGFLTSAKNNGGYYIARYESSYGGGFTGEGKSDWYLAKYYENAKPLSKVSIAQANTMSYNEGTLWNYITQLAASKVSRNMYAGNKDVNNNSVGVESDLMNSYAWDTAIVYIRQMKAEYANFANFKYNTAYGSKNVGSTTRNDTGKNDGDNFCNIYDMVANCMEWTTEYSTSYGGSNPTSCVYRGDYYSYTYGFTASRGSDYANVYRDDTAFRPLCYIK